jgi:hypothetical protein
MFARMKMENTSTSGDSGQRQTRNAVITSVMTRQFCCQTIASNQVVLFLREHVCQYEHREL